MHTRLEQVFGVEEPDHRVDLLAAGEHQPTPLLNDLAPQRLRGVGEIDPLDVGARCHERTHQAVAEAEDPLDDLVLLRLHDAALGPLLVRPSLGQAPGPG